MNLLRASPLPFGSDGALNQSDAPSAQMPSVNVAQGISKSWWSRNSKELKMNSRKGDVALQQPKGIDCNPPAKL